MVWYSHLFQNFPQFIVIHTVKGFGVVNKAEIDIFLELSCFFHDPADVGNLISGSSAFSKASLNIRKFTVHILLRPGLENFEHYFSCSLLIHKFKKIQCLDKADIYVSNETMWIETFANNLSLLISVYRSFKDIKKKDQKRPISK